MRLIELRLGNGQLKLLMVSTKVWSDALDVSFGEPPFLLLFEGEWVEQRRNFGVSSGALTLRARNVKLWDTVARRDDAAISFRNILSNLHVELGVQGERR